MGLWMMGPGPPGQGRLPHAECGESASTHGASCLGATVSLKRKGVLTATPLLNVATGPLA